VEAGAIFVVNVLEQELKHSNTDVRGVCGHALSLASPGRKENLSRKGEQQESIELRL